MRIASTGEVVVVEEEEDPLPLFLWIRLLLRRLLPAAIVAVTGMTIGVNK